MKSLFSNASRRSYKTKEHQTGRSDLFRDRTRTAKNTGRRISKSGKFYYESRKNRSDKIGQRI